MKAEDEALKKALDDRGIDYNNPKEINRICKYQDQMSGYTTYTHCTIPILKVINYFSQETLSYITRFDTYPVEK